MNVLVTGANGFVGKALIDKLIDHGHHVTALVRSKKKHGKRKDRIKWIEGDLLFPEMLPVLKNIDKAYYLVHGLKGEEKSFEYDEAMAAVNFINWIRPTCAGIIYLGALGPNIHSLSPHLRSRHLTGAILGASGLSMIEFRASIILGEESVSFEMIKAMSERLPVRPDIPLLNQASQPLAMEDLLNYLEGALELPNEGHKIFEIGGPDVVSYGELLDLYAKLSGIKRFKIKFPEMDVRVLLTALDLAIPELSQIGRKLAISLEHPTVVTNDLAKKAFPDIHPLPLKEAMDRARKESTSHYAPLWEKDFLTQSRLLSPELLRNLEKVGKLREIISRK